MAKAATSPQKHWADPTDMSKAPQTMTIVIPMTIKPSSATPSKSVRTDSTLRKRGLR